MEIHSEWLLYISHQKVRNQPENWQEMNSLGFLCKPLIVDLFSRWTAAIPSISGGLRLVSWHCQVRQDPVKLEDEGPLCGGCHLSSVLKDEQDFFVWYAYIKLGLCMHHC